MTRVDAEAEDGPVSAVGGSARSQLYELDDRSWAPRPIAALAIAGAAFAIPVTTAVVAVQVVARLVPRPAATPGLVIWTVALVALATATMWTVDHASRRLLPLAAMLRLSLVFPDEAPSRFSVALRAGSGKALQRSLARHATDTDFSTSRQLAELVVALLGEVSTHDRLTRGHSERVRAYADLIGAELGLDAESKNKLHWAALLHDVGKLDVPAAILNKTERLTPPEWNIIRGHPAAGDVRIEPVRAWLGEWARAASEHHERYDGDGYPHRLRGDEISLAGRIVAVADAFDVMTAARSYKKPYPAAQARVELAKNAGTQFDPAVVRAFLAISLGKLRLVMGPLAWLSGLSGLFSLGGIASGAAAAVSAVVVAASAFATPAATPTRRPVPVELAATSHGSGPTPDSGGSDAGGADAPRDETSGSRTSPLAGGAAGLTTGTDPRIADTVPEAPVVGGVTVTTAPSGIDPRPGAVAPIVSPTTAPAAPISIPTPTTHVPGAVTTTTLPASTQHAPTARDDVRASSVKDLMIDVLANDADADGNLRPSSLTIASLPAGGYKKIEVDNRQIRVQVAKHTSATVVFIYRICDTTNLCSNARVTITFTNAD